jgi:hypothetical protein
VKPSRERLLKLKRPVVAPIATYTDRPLILITPMTGMGAEGP